LALGKLSVSHDIQHRYVQDTKYKRNDEVEGGESVVDLLVMGVFQSEIMKTCLGLSREMRVFASRLPVGGSEGSCSLWLKRENMYRYYDS
jgi:hypothetical protein